jgi:hypothetical protein
LNKTPQPAILAHVQQLTGDQAEHQILGIFRSLVYAGQAQPQQNKQADCDPREQKKSKVRVMPCAASASPQVD